MKLKKIEKKEQGRFITRYDLTYETAIGTEKVYEIISRDRALVSQEQLFERPTDAVIMILCNEQKDKLLLLREFRLAVGEWIYNFPAGLLNAGESREEAARRELREECGLELCSIFTWLPDSYVAVGFSNERNACLFGEARGEISASDSADEEIEAAWYSKDEVRQLLQQGVPFEARTQMYAWLWCSDAVLLPDNNCLY